MLCVVSYNHLQWFPGESLTSGVMLEYNTKPEVDVDNSNTEGEAGPSSDGKVSLTKIWEIIVRTNRLPDEFDIQTLFISFRDRLCDPEKEVRQHALRVLSDLIPILDSDTLDDNMQLILTEIVTNLGYSAPSVRKSAIDCLKIYLKHTEKPNEILTDLVSKGVENASVNEVPVNTVLGIIMSLPHFLIETITDSNISYIIFQLFSKASQILFQETSLKSIVRIRRKLGRDRFESFLEDNMNDELHNLCEIYNFHELPEEVSSGDGMREPSANWSDSRSSDSTEVEDKVILETEIKLNSGSAITMKIHEESRANSVNGISDSDEDARHGSGVVRVLTDDSEQEYYEARRTPRRVRFGGEVVKMRTPESDSNQPSDDNETIVIEQGPSIHITVRDSSVSSIKTKTKHTYRSMIPVKMKSSSEPSTPKKKSFGTKKRHHRSTPELSITSRFGNSKIPLRHRDSFRSKQTSENTDSRNKRQQQRQQKAQDIQANKIKTERQTRGKREQKVAEQNVLDALENKEMKPNAQKGSSKELDLLKVENIPTRSRRGSLSSGRISPAPSHHGIEILHNLMRSPEPRNTDNQNENVVAKEGSAEGEANMKEKNRAKSDNKILPAIGYSSFKVVPDSSTDKSGVSETEEPNKEVIVIIEKQQQEEQHRREQQQTQEQQSQQQQEKPQQQYQQEQQLNQQKQQQQIQQEQQQKQQEQQQKQQEQQQKQQEQQQKQQEQHQKQQEQVQQQKEQLQQSQKQEQQKQHQNKEASDVTNEENNRSVYQAIKEGSQQQDDTSNNANKLKTINESMSEALNTTSEYKNMENQASEKGTEKHMQTIGNRSFKIYGDESQERITEDTVIQECTKGYTSRPGSRCHQIREETSIIEPSILNDLCCKEDISARSRGIENLIMSLKWPETCPGLDTAPALLLLHVLFSCEQQIRLQSQAQEALHMLLSNLSHDVVKNCLKQIVHGLSKMGSPDGTRLSVLVMQRVTPAIFIRHLVSEQHHRTNSRAREGTLQLLIAACRTFPSCDIEVTRGTELAVRMMKDRKRRVRQAALDALACLAQVSSNGHVLEIAEEVVKEWEDREDVLRVIRIRLSRRQLPNVDATGCIRYTAPRDQTELDWLSNGTINNNHPVDDSVIHYRNTALSDNENNNYWKRHSRHKTDALLPTSDSAQFNSDSDWSESKDKSINDSNAQIWAIDPSVLPGHNKYNNNPTAALRPVYIVQPEKLIQDKSSSIDSISNHHHGTPMTYRRYDRGRSFSPPKETYRNPNPTGTRADYSDQELGGSLSRRNRRLGKHKEVFRKSFSSEQLYSNTNKLREGYPFSLSSGSSSTSTGSTGRKGVWSKDFRSSIPIPIHPDHKLRLRVSRNQATLTAPLLAQDPIHRETLPSPRTTPLLCRVSPVKQHPSSPPGGSESSGYVTPPAEQHLNDQPFIRLTDSDTELCEVDNALPPDDYRIVESIECEVETKIIMKTDSNVERKSSASTSDSSVDPVAQEDHNHHHESHDEEQDIRIRRESTSNSLNEYDLIDTPRSFIEQRNKSRSEVDLKTTLPDISDRKNINSAPSLNKINKPPEKIYAFEELPAATPKTSLPGSMPCHEDEEEGVSSSANEKEEVKDFATARRLTRRISNRPSLQRTPSVSSSRREVTVFPTNLRPYSKPKDSLQETLNQLESSEWEMTMRGLQGLVRTLRHHPDIVESHMHKVCVLLGKHIKNLRSQVARAACVAASELFGTCKRGLDMELEELVPPLLQRTADTNKFLRGDANMALDVMAQHIQPHRVVHLIANRGCSHQNGVVRAASARILNDLASRLGPDRVFQLPKDVRDRILLCGATALTEGSLDCRKYGKNMLALLSSHPNFHKNLLDAVPPHILRHIGKTLKSFKSQC